MTCRDSELSMAGKSSPAASRSSGDVPGVNGGGLGATPAVYAGCLGTRIPPEITREILIYGVRRLHKEAVIRMHSTIVLSVEEVGALLHYVPREDAVAA